MDAGSHDATPDASSDASSGSSGSSGSATNVGGAFVARGATFERGRNESGEQLVDIVLADVADVCGTDRTETLTKVLHLTLRGAQFAPGSYRIVLDTVVGGSGPAPQGTAILWEIFESGGDSCSLSYSDGGASGTVTLTRAADDAVEGTVDLALEKGNGRVTGSFHAVPCVAPGRKSFACALGR